MHQFNNNLNVDTEPLAQLLVFSITPFKIDRNEAQNFQKMKSRTWEKKETKFAKPLAKVQVTAFFS